MDELFKQSLRKIVSECEGAVAGVVMGFDGIAIDTVSIDSAVDVSTISMEFSFVLSQVRKAAEVLDVGALEEVSIRSANLTFIIRVLSQDYFLGLALKPEGNFGKGRFLMRMAMPDLRAGL
jgi:predicted regulator of Ras-like GTPase activity (Roadblock/LC7/MglB family)